MKYMTCFILSLFLSLTKSGFYIQFVWISGHSGIVGKQYTDFLAKLQPRSDVILVAIFHCLTFVLNSESVEIIYGKTTGIGFLLILSLGTEIFLQLFHPTPGFTILTLLSKPISSTSRL